jgi:hypothetical protein
MVPYRVHNGPLTIHNLSYTLPNVEVFNKQHGQMEHHATVVMTQYERLLNSLIFNIKLKAIHEMCD